MLKIKFILTTIALLIFALGPSALAQTSKGIVVGTVLDPNGAAVSGATVKITNTATGVSKETTSGTDGTYRIEAVDPGSYNVTVNAAGFKASTRENVAIAGSQTNDLPFSLEVGSANEVVQVTSDTVILQSQDGTRVNTLDTRQITELPVAGLNPVNLVFTLPGVVNPGNKAGGFVQGTEFSVNGLRPRANNQLIDGLDNNDNSIGGQFYQPVLRDGYNEVTVLQGDFSAEYGRAGGAVVNVISQNGTNSFHGSAYDVINSSTLSALTPGQKSTEGLTSVPRSIENTFGFSVGGPVIKNKLFFFGTFQPDLTRTGAVTATANVPTAAGVATLRSIFPAGASPNLDAYLAAIGSIRGVTNTRTVALGGGRPGVEFGTASISSTQPVNDYQGLFRVDYARKDTDTYAVRYLFDKQLFSNQSNTITLFPGFEQDTTALIQNAYINNTRTFSVKTTNELRFGFGRFNLLFGERNAANNNGGPQILFAGSAANFITPIGLNALFPQGRIFNNYQIQDTVAHTIGNHSLRFGLDLNIQKSKQFVPFNNRGTLTFSSGGGFNAFANFVDQFSGSTGVFASKVFGSPVIYPNAFYQNYFVNDSWRVRDNLTLQLGLRYENYGTPFNAVPFPAFAGLNAPLTTVVKQRRDNNNFAPRLSFAYTPRFKQSLIKTLFGEDRSVIRGGFAVNYDFFFNNILSNTAATPPNVFGSATLGGTGRGIAGATPNNTALLPTTGTPSPTGSVNSIDPNLVNPLTYVWNLGIQRQMRNGLLLDLAYVGSRGTHLFINEQVNPGNPATGKRLNPARGSILIRDNGGDSIYHSLQARVERGFRKGLFMRAAYTFSKAIDDVNSEVFTTTGGTTTPSDPLGLFGLGGKRADRSVASYDVPHRFVVTALYDIPSPFTSKLGKDVFGGFTLTGIYRIQSGNVETPFIGGLDLNGDLSGFNDRPAISNPNAPATSVAFNNDFAPAFGCDASTTGFFDGPNCNPINLANARYLVDFNVRTGLAGRNSLRSPLTNSLDLSLNKAIRVPFTHIENDKLDIRVEFFNVLNHPDFTFGGNDANADGDVTNQFFNQPRLNGGSSRTGRIQIRYSF